MSRLRYVPFEEFERVQMLPCSAIERAKLFATLCRINILYMIMRAGSGHIGSSFSCLDVVTWLYLQELRGHPDGAPGTRDVYFSSKGHDVPALYAVLTGLGRLPFEQLHGFRRLNGLPGHPDIAIPGVETNTGSLGMGISKAKGMIMANRLQGKSGDVFVLTGDGELQEGQIWESLIGAANRQMEELFVIVDHNKVQSDTWVKAISDLGDLEKKFLSFGCAVRRCNGHDVAQIRDVVKELRELRAQPKALIADTIKGQGVSFMAHTAMGPNNRLYRYHSGAPTWEEYVKGCEELIDQANRQLNLLQAAPLGLAEMSPVVRSVPEHPQRLVPAYSRALVALAERHPEIVVLDADLALDCGLLPFEERYPDRMIECGIAEQDMVSQAGGLALRGLLPIVHSFACFLSARPNEQIYNNASENKKIIYVGSLAGLLPGGPGHSHQAVRDIAALAAVPHLILLEPSCEAEVGDALAFCVERCRESCYLRLVSVPYDVPFTLPSDYRLTLGQGIELSQGEDVLVFGYGPILLSEAYKASELLLAQYGLGVKVVNFPWLNRVDREWLAQITQGYRYIVTLDNHYIVGGQGMMLSSALAELHRPVSIKRLGISGFPMCGANDEVLAAHRLDALNLVEDIASFVRIS